MVFQLRAGEPVAKGLRRIARDQIDKALEALEHAGGPEREKVIHDARKRFKKVRGLIRLARPGLSKKLYDRENALFRDAGHPLSEVRDAGVLIKALDNVRQRSGLATHPEAFDAARAELLERRRAVHTQVLESGRAVETVADTVRKARRGFKRWKLAGDGDEVLLAGLRRIYRLGRRAYRAASYQTSDENLHEWRKRVKDLWYACDILRSVLPDFVANHRDEAERLADLLGDDHDLAVLRQILTDGDRATSAPLLPLIDHHRAELQHDALAIGRRIFAEKPKTLAARLEV